jgi:hypothetical protein
MTVHELAPTTSRVAVRRAGHCWAVQIVTPAAGQALRTTVARFDEEDDARTYAADAQARMTRGLIRKQHVTEGRA